METINEKDESLRRLFFEFLDFFFWMKCANSLNNGFKFVRGIWALQKVKELHKQLACFICPSIVSILYRKVLTGFL